MRWLIALWRFLWGEPSGPPPAPATQALAILPPATTSMPHQFTVRGTSRFIVGRVVLYVCASDRRWYRQGSVGLTMADTTWEVTCTVGGLAGSPHWPYALVAALNPVEDESSLPALPTADRFSKPEYVYRAL